VKAPVFQPEWPESWKQALDNDNLEFFGNHKKDLAYYYHYKVRFAETIQAVKKYVPEGGSILDIAASQGNFSLRLAELGYAVTWNDLRAELADYVKLKYESGNLQFLPGNVFDLNLDEKYDGIVITEVIEHTAHPDEFLQKVSEFLKPDGVIIMTTPNGAYFRNKLPRFSDCPDPSVYEEMQFKPDADGHIFLLYLDEIKTLSARAGLKIKEYKFYSNPLINGHIKSRLILPYLPEKLVMASQKLVNLNKTLSEKVSLGTLAVFSR